MLFLRYISSFYLGLLGLFLYVTTFLFTNSWIHLFLVWKLVFLRFNSFYVSFAFHKSIFLGGEGLLVPLWCLSYPLSLHSFFYLFIPLFSWFVIIKIKNEDWQRKKGCIIQVPQSLYTFSSFPLNILWFLSQLLISWSHKYASFDKLLATDVFQLCLVNINTWANIHTHVHRHMHIHTYTNTYSTHADKHTHAYLF